MEAALANEPSDVTEASSCDVSARIGNEVPVGFVRSLILVRDSDLDEVVLRSLVRVVEPQCTNVLSGFVTGFGATNR